MSVDSFDSNLVSDISKATGLAPVLSALLINRGIRSRGEALDFIHPSLDKLTPFNKFPNISDACDIVRKHLRSDSKIMVFGDYDCDGIGASAIMYSAIKGQGGNVEVFIPTRQEDGYGLSLPVLEKLFKTRKPDLIITVDCGISAVEEVEYIKENGIDILITDHHEPQEILPKAIILNPKCGENLPELCGAGVAFTLVRALFGDNIAFSNLDILAISTIADLVPLIGDNRILCYHGLKMLAGRNLRPGLKELLRASGHGYGDAVSGYEVAFKLAPRLNASGRLSSAYKSFELLTSCDNNLVKLIAEELENENKARQDLCAKTIDEAEEMLKSYSISTKRIIALYNPNWEGGVVGIAASKLAQDYMRPTILFTKKDNILRGSGRSVKGINLHDLLTENKSLLIQYGGHEMAAGLSIEPNNLSAFIESADRYIRRNCGDEPFFHDNFYDADMDFSCADINFAEGLSKLEPFGMGNPRPIFKHEYNKLNFVPLGRHPHLKCSLGKGTELIAFNSKDLADDLNSHNLKQLYFTLEKSVYRNRVSAKGYLKDVVFSDVYTDRSRIVKAYYSKFAMPETDLTDEENYEEIIRDELFGHLVICFNENTYNMLKRVYPTYKKASGRLASKNPYNTILIAPLEDDKFHSFIKIDVYDKPPKNYINYLKSLYGGAVRESFSGMPVFYDALKDVCIESLRECYTALRALNGSYYFNDNALYKLISDKGYKVCEEHFVANLLILQDIGLFTIDNNSIINITANKVSPLDSEIYKAIKRNAGNPQ